MTQDLQSDGHIKPHIDSSRFCGDTVAVLSLLSDSVARFRLDKDRVRAPIFRKWMNF